MPEAVLPEAYDFDVAVSFAGEDRAYVSDVVDAIKGDLEVFYDEDQIVETWGEDLVEYFTAVYSRRCRFVVMFISRHYADKMWTNVERRAALSTAITKRGAYILPVRLDDTALPGLLPTVGYLNANRLGLERISEAIRQKVTGGESKSGYEPKFDGKVPGTQEAVERLLTERPPGWEYFLYASLLQRGLADHEDAYRDHSVQYAKRTGRLVSRDNIREVVDGANGSVMNIISNFNAVLKPGVHEAAFGAPGVPGDPDRIIHLARRFVSVYEDFLAWSAELRGATASGESIGEALGAMSHMADQPIEAMREFVTNFVDEIESSYPRAIAGENVKVNMVITLTLGDEIVAEFLEKYREALTADD
ncbi:TIR domain-containing protein [Cellulosimicrobium cellulans]|nr:TIR domain-containing protein [Cellulosimicrobium cellulans]